MEFDLFFSLAQSPRDGGQLPSHARLLAEFLDQAVLADELGYGCIWVAESHFSSELQKQHRQPVIVSWQGEIGVNSDICQLATQVFRRTRRIEVGSAIMNIVANGGPIPAAEKVANALAWHGLDERERRRLHIGFAGGRFDYIGRTTGISPRTAWEERAWPKVKTAILWEASEIFTRLLLGEAISSDDVAERRLEPHMFASLEELRALATLAGTSEDFIVVPRRWRFELTRIVPDFRRELLQLLVGSHDLELQVALNRYRPVQVFNLSITPPAVIEKTHARMATAYHPAGGQWQRSCMPRTVMVFLNTDARLGATAQRAAAAKRAQSALAAYWRGLEGTVDASKIAASVDNALVGTADDIAAAIAQRFHPDDRLMLWFDLFADSSAQVLDGIRGFKEQVIPRLAQLGIPVSASPGARAPTLQGLGG